jgi:hypothetical protein
MAVVTLRVVQSNDCSVLVRDLSDVARWRYSAWRSECCCGWRGMRWDQRDIAFEEGQAHMAGRVRSLWKLTVA